MSKKDKNPPKREEYKAADYYDLKTNAIRDLVEADESNSPPVSEQELRKYRSGLKVKIPDLVKVCFIKWWFPAAVCFFFLWGLGMYVSNTLDMLFITGIGLGIVTDILTNNALRFFEPSPGAWGKWVMFYKKGYSSFVFNILYAYVLLMLVFFTYGAINYAITYIRGLPEVAAYLGVEPFIFGTLYLAYDTLLVQCRNTFRNIVSDARKPGR